MNVASQPPTEPEVEAAPSSPAPPESEASPLFRLYFLRHAPAGSRAAFEGPDDERPLTKDGRKKLREAKRGLRTAIGVPDIIVASPYARTQETARILADTLKYTGEIELNDHLVHGGRPEMLGQLLASHTCQRDVVLVGHSPDLERWIAHAVLGREDGGFLELKKGGVCRVDILTIEPELRGVIRWVLPPNLLRAVG